MPLPSFVQQHVDAFLAAIQPVEDAYHYDTFTYLAVRSPDGFMIVQGSVILNVAPSALRSTSFNSGSVRAGHHKLADLGLTRVAFIHRLCEGSLNTPEGHLLFPANEGNYGSIYVPFHNFGLAGQRRLGALSIFGADGRNLINQPTLDWELRAAETPYDGLQDLMREYQLGALRGGLNTVEIFALDVAAIDPASKVEGEVAKITVRFAGSLDKNKAAVGTLLLHQGRVVRRVQIRGSEIKWQMVDGFHVGTATVEVPRAAVLQCTAIYGGSAQHYYWIADPSTFQNARRAAYEVFDPGFAVLRDIVEKAQGRRPDARTFESAVSWLFWMLGFSPVHLGGTPRTQDATDVLLCTSFGHFAVVEVTTGLLKADNKLSILHDRSQALRRTLDASNAKHLRVLPVIVTCKTRDEVLPDIDQAERLGIHVLTRENIDTLMQGTLVPQNADQLYEQAEQSVRAALDRRTAEHQSFNLP